MKNNYYFRVLLLTCIVFSSFHYSLAQTTKDLFSRPGLSLGATHFNFFDGTWSTSYRYTHDTILCGDTLLVFQRLISTKSEFGLKIEGAKVRSANLINPCEDGPYYYDFDLQVGQIFDAAPIGGGTMTVKETGQKALLNGDMRRYLRLARNPSSTWSIEWIEGLGDVTNGLFPAFYDFEGYDQYVCARDSTGDLWSAPVSSDSYCDSLLCPVPIVTFSRNISNKQVQFFNGSTDTYEWHWDFGDGQFSNEKNPEHEYDNPGCYEVCLTARTPCLQREFKYCLPTPVCIDPVWVIQNTPSLPASAIISEMTFPAPDTGWIISASKVWKTVDGGLSWAEQSLPPAPANTTRIITSLHMANTQLGILGCGSYGSSPLEANIFVTTDGQNWIPRLQGDGPWISDAVILPSGKGYAVASYNGLMVTNDFGQNWEEKAYPQGPLQGFIHPTTLLPINNDTLYLLGGFESFQGPPLTPFLMRTFNDGDSWEFQHLPGTRIFNAAYFFNAREGWLPGGLGHLLHTLDAGFTWQEVPFFESTNVFDIDFANRQHGWAVGGKGLVLHTIDGGQTWARENCGYISEMTTIAARDTVQAYTSSNLFHLLRFAPSGAPLCGASNAEEPLESPRKGHLRIFPNPANTHIGIQLEGVEGYSDLTILIVNQLGQVVMNKAVDTVTREINVSTLPPGIYGIQLLSDEVVSASGRFVVGR